eukprot:5699663-Alexandrium_andersonii.AAC.1
MLPATFPLLVALSQMATEVLRHITVIPKRGSGILLLIWRRSLFLEVTVPCAAAASAGHRATWALQANEL